MEILLTNNFSNFFQPIQKVHGIVIKHWFLNYLSLLSFSTDVSSDLYSLGFPETTDQFSCFYPNLPAAESSGFHSLWISDTKFSYSYTIIIWHQFSRLCHLHQNTSAAIPIGPLNDKISLFQSCIYSLGPSAVQSEFKYQCLQP